VYEDAVTFTYESLPATEYGDSLATIKEKARLNVPMFKEDTFAKYIADLSIADYDNESVYLLDPHAFTFSYTDPQTALTDIATLQTLDFTLTGNTKVVWRFDPDKLKSDLAGIEKVQATNVFTSYPSIGNAQAEVRPFWKSTFPENTEDITITPIIE
jgi:hypothetical protein